MDEKIAFCEAWYARHRQTPMFRQSAALAPSSLDGALAARGYRREVNTVVMTLALDALNDADTTAPEPGLRVVERSVGEGIAEVHRLIGSDPAEALRDVRRQGLWQGDEIFLSLRSINGLIGCGMARVESAHVGIFSLRTLPEARGRGYARQLLGQLLDWGRQRGASSAFLQVDEDNLPAIAVYRRFGFVARYPYWLRIAPTRPVTSIELKDKP
jgi:GNAT superfamily N-acetyltransferase